MTTVFDFNSEWREKLVQRFISYVKIFSTSDPASEKTPSTDVQWDIARYIKNELEQLGLSHVRMDDKGYIFAEIPSNISQDVPCIGFLAHYDTSPDFSGNNVNPQIFENYQGENLLLNKSTGFTLSPKKFESLKKHIGETIITTDGTTLLGADDKAGIAEIVTAAEYLLAHPEIEHGKIMIGFNPDEEIGRGAHHFNVKDFGADWAYTMDGSEVGELEYENFNAAGAVLHFHGLSVHPGYAFGKMKNAALLAAEFAHSMPANETPATTREFEGFFHLMHIEANITDAKLEYIIRDHDAQKYHARKTYLVEKVEEFNKKHGENTVEISIQEQYRNMKEQFEGKLHIIRLAEEAMNSLGIEPDIKAIRGGTDGAQLSFMGLPCPNIFAGGLNFHGPYEYVPVENMIKAVQVIIEISRKLPAFHQNKKD